MLIRFLSMAENQTQKFVILNVTPGEISLSTPQGCVIDRDGVLSI